MNTDKNKEYLKYVANSGIPLPNMKQAKPTNYSLNNLITYLWHTARRSCAQCIYDHTVYINHLENSDKGHQLIGRYSTYENYPRKEF